MRPGQAAARLPDEIGALGRLLFRKAVCIPRQGNAPHQECHVPGQGAHGLHPLRVLGRFAGETAVDAVPILAGGDGHAGYGEEFVQLVKGGLQPAPAGRDNRRAYFHGLGEGRTVKQPCEEGD